MLPGIRYPPFNWDIALNLGDYAGFWDAPEDEQATARANNRLAHCNKRNLASDRHACSFARKPVWATMFLFGIIFSVSFLKNLSASSRHCSGLTNPNL
jgi:hypothetical protein